MDSDQYPFDLGSYQRKITTNSAEAQLWFDRGLNWSYGFNHAEARRCYKRAAEADPNCAMAYWGMAYAIGPYYNLSWPEYSADWRPHAIKRTNQYVLKAQQLSQSATEIERGLIDALASRFPSDCEPVDEDVYADWDNSYANSMLVLQKKYPEDYDLCALSAEALICRTPWQLWDLEKEQPATDSSTAEAIAIVETALVQIKERGEPSHPGLLHFYIHIMEMSPTPEKALHACEALFGLVPDSGHLQHMPSHIYVLCGQYQASFQVNVDAGIADRKWEAYDDTIGTYTLYRLHNIHFKIYSALLLGQYQNALDSAEEIQRLIPPDGLQNEHEYIVNYLEGFSGMLPHVYIRFGKWDDIIAAKLPEDQALYCVTTAMWHYAKGVAYAATGDVENALIEQEKFQLALERVPAERRIFNNYCRDILRVGEEMLAGELAYRRENYGRAYDHLRRSVAICDQLNYTEPWAWMQPPRHALGALLMEQGHIDEAMQVYRADLGLDKTLVRPAQHIDNVWSLHGYVECLEKLGQIEDAEKMGGRLEAAQKLADVPIGSSCFCRQAEDCCE